jgi:hypothetical protein
MVGSSIFWSWKALRKCSSAVHSRKEAIRNEALCCNTWRVANSILMSAKFPYYSAPELNPDRCIDSVEAEEEE